MLYFIPTPIGNKQDITLRALDLLKALNVFFCEDTRTTKKLLSMYEIDYKDKKFYPYTSFVQGQRLSSYVEIMKTQDCGVVSEAGTPGISDPGKELIRLCRENDIKFDVLPGANAIIPAIVGSNFNTSEFTYLGFLPKKKGKQTKMKSIVESKIPVFIYESVYRVEKTLQEMKKLGFEGKVGVFRELSKMFEQKEFGDVDEMLSMLSSGKMPLKGEFVIGFYPKDE